MSAKVSMIVTVAGVFLGGGMICTALWVWVATSTFGTPGYLLCLLGTMLVGLSVWKKVSITSSVISIEIERVVK